MRYTVILSALALDQIATILEWQSEHISAASARQFANALSHFKVEVAKNPKRYPPFMSIDDARVALVYHHNVAYWVDNEAKSVEVLAIRHQSQHPDRLLDDISSPGTPQP